MLCSALRRRRTGLSVTSNDVICTGNYVDGGLVLRDFRRATVTHNTIVGESSVVQLEGAGRVMLDGLRWDENDYYVTDGRWGECALVEENKSRGATFAEWRKATGSDGKSTFTRGEPRTLRVIVRPTIYDQGRAHVAVLNPGELPEVDVDLSNVLSRGQPFRIVSAKDFYGEPVVSGSYDGGFVKLPMRPVRGPQPVGLDDADLPVTEPRFGAFVVMTRNE
jgi:hypothetical protein